MSGEHVWIGEGVTMSWYPVDGKIIATIWTPDVASGDPCGTQVGTLELTPDYLRFMRDVYLRRPATTTDAIIRPAAQE